MARSSGAVFFLRRFAADGSRNLRQKHTGRFAVADVRILLLNVVSDDSGGRRAGKTKFLGECAKGKKCVFFSAQRLNSFTNLRLFEKAVEAFSGTPEHFDKWKDAFARIADFAKEERF